VNFRKKRFSLEFFRERKSAIKNSSVFTDCQTRKLNRTSKFLCHFVVTCDCQDLYFGIGCAVLRILLRM